MSELYRRISLYDLPFSARLTLAAFLISVGIGYFSALVQLHAQQAKPGQILPGEPEVIDSYHGKPGMGVMERLIVADETLPLSSNGSMRSAFTRLALDFTDPAIEDRASTKYMDGLSKDLKDEEKQEKWDQLPKEEKEKKLEEARKELRAEHEGEIEVTLDWIHGGVDKESYDKDKYPLPDSLKDKPLTPKFKVAGNNGVPAVKIKSLIRSRCVRCHQAGREAADAPLVDYKQIAYYAKKDVGQTGGMPLRKLAQSTHVHLLGFSMLYGLTGLIFACSSWPGLIRFVIAPLALVAQIVDVSFWWLARLQDPYGSEFAKCIRFSGMVVAGSLGIQIVGSLFSLFGWFGRFVLVLLIAGAVVGAYFVNDLVIAPYLAAQAKLVAP